MMNSQNSCSVSTEYTEGVQDYPVLERRTVILIIESIQFS